MKTKSRAQVTVGDHVYLPADPIQEVEAASGVVVERYSMAKPGGPEEFIVIELDDALDVCEVSVDDLPAHVRVEPI